MVATMFHDILLLALVKAYGNRSGAFLMLEQIEPAVRQIEQANPALIGTYKGVTAAIITLDNQKLIRIERGRIYLREAGLHACRGLELQPEWISLPDLLKAKVRT